MQQLQRRYEPERTMEQCPERHDPQVVAPPPVRCAAMPQHENRDGAARHASIQFACVIELAPHRLRVARHPEQILVAGHLYYVHGSPCHPGMGLVQIEDDGLSQEAGASWARQPIARSCRSSCRSGSSDTT